jgi:two-component system cell cycle sensor histidine kinase/response regulator CckA
MTALAAAGACIPVPSAYAILALLDLVPMNVGIYLGWLVWLQAVHAAAGLVLWRHRATFSSRLKTLLLFWGGLAFWYWLPAPIYFLLTMNIDALQLKWTALAFFWEVPVVGGAFVLVVQRLFPSSRRHPRLPPAGRYRDVVRYPTKVALLLFIFTLAGYVLGALQLRWFADMPVIEQVKNAAHGLVISLLLAVFYYLALDRVLEPVRARIAREHGLGAVVARTVAGRILGVSTAVAVAGFALIGLFVLQAFQGMVRESLAETVRQDLIHLAAAPEMDSARLTGPRAWGERGRLLVVRVGDELPDEEFSPETRRQVAAAAAGVVHDTRRDLKVVGFIRAPRLEGTLVGVAFLADSYGPLWSAGRLLGFAGACVLVVTLGMLAFASRASTRAVRALSSAVRRVEAGDVDEADLRLDTADEIGELSAVVERYVRQSRDLRATLETKVRDKTSELSAKLEEIERQDAALRRSAQRLEALQHIDRSILAAESGEPIARAALPRLRRIVPFTWAAVLLFEAEHGHARVVVTDGAGSPAEGTRLPVHDLPAAETLQAKGVRYLEDLEARRHCLPVFDRLLQGGTRSLISAPLAASGATIGLLVCASTEPAGFDRDHTEIVGEVANQLAVALHQARLHEALDREQRRLHAVVEHLPEGVLLLDRDGRIALANPFARAHVSGLVALSAAGDIASIGGVSLSALLSAPETEPREITTEGPIPQVFQMAARRLDGPQGPQGCVLVLRDVTRERESQRAAQQQARLAAVGQLAAGIAHDFNNILMTIMNSAELARRRQADAAFAGARLDTILKQVDRAAALVRQILDFGRRSAPALQPVDLAVLVQQTIGLLDRTLPETIRVVLETVPGRFVIDADLNQLSQVLTNLAVNARDAMPGGGELRFRLFREPAAAEARPAAAAAPDWLVLTVSDTGTGMPAEVRERVFEPFFTTKAPGQGTGLGLSQAYGIVQQHGGQIAVESEPGRGTVFTLRFPALLAGAPSTGPAVEGGPSVAGQGETLLVVEDEAGVRNSVAQILDDLNYRVLTAASAEEALGLHAEHGGGVALVLSDLVMPGIGGLGLVHGLRARGARVPVVIMSGYMADTARQGVDGVVAWVQKPVSAARLGTIIHDALAGRV